MTRRRMWAQAAARVLALFDGRRHRNVATSSFCSGRCLGCVPWRFSDAASATPDPRWSIVYKDWELDARELAVLDCAARQADVNDALERAIRRDGYMIEGASGQRRLNAAVTELRQGRLALARLLGQLALPAEDADAKGATATSRKAQKAARARWHREVVGGQA
jgi:hypothetical protein